MSTKTLQQRYDQFCHDAEELLQYAGFETENSKPVLTGKALLQTFNTLASIHLPEDKEVGGLGPRGLIWSMYSVFESKSNNDLEGSLALVRVVRYIIKYRPEIQPDTGSWRTRKMIEPTS